MQHFIHLLFAFVVKKWQTNSIHIFMNTDWFVYPMFLKAALAHGVMAGRRGYGSIYVVASGNGGHFKDNCNFDGYANSIFTVTIGEFHHFRNTFSSPILNHVFGFIAL